MRKNRLVPLLVPALLIALAAVALGIAIGNGRLFSAVDLRQGFYQPAPTPGAELAALEDHALIAIPPGARQIYGQVSQANDERTWARFDLPDADLPAFMDETLCSGPLIYAPSRKPKPAPGEPRWWQPQRAAYLEGCEGLDDYVFQRVLVDRSRRGAAIVYIYSLSQRESDSLNVNLEP